MWIKRCNCLEYWCPHYCRIIGSNCFLFASINNYYCIIFAIFLASHTCFSLRALYVDLVQKYMFKEKNVTNLSNLSFDLFSFYINWKTIDLLQKLDMFPIISSLRQLESLTFPERWALWLRLRRRWESFKSFQLFLCSIHLLDCILNLDIF